MVAKIVVGSRIFDIPDVAENVTYKISPSCFKGVRDSAFGDIIKIDMAGLISRGHKLISNKQIPVKFHESEIREDLLHSDDRHDYEAQKLYLKETRRIWEAKYTLDEMLWLDDFRFCISELDGKVSDNWWRLYEIIKGEMPADFPTGLRFPIFIDNVLTRYCDRTINNIMKSYIREHPDDAKRIRDKLEIPDNLILMPEIGLTPSTYFSYIKKYGYILGE